MKFKISEVVICGFAPGLPATNAPTAQAKSNACSGFDPFKSLLIKVAKKALMTVILIIIK